jgi:hypothetical protein
MASACFSNRILELENLFNFSSWMESSLVLASFFGHYVNQFFTTVIVILEPRQAVDMVGISSASYVLTRTL